MSPEQALGQPVDARTDIYSLGAVMYEMLTGCKPFTSNDDIRLLQQIAHKNPPAPHSVDPNIPVSLSHIVMKAMSKRPEKRYQTAEEMAKDIKRFILSEKRVKRDQRHAVPEKSAAHAVTRRGTIWLGCAVGLVGLIVLAVRLLR
jgi:serine/threonine protein kinase